MTEAPRNEPSPLFSRGEAWDRFIDELDRCGQAGTAPSVVVPEFNLDFPFGPRFTDLTRQDVERLARYATSLGRRGDTIRTPRGDPRRPPARATKRRRRPRV